MAFGRAVSPEEVLYKKNRTPWVNGHPRCRHRRGRVPLSPESPVPRDPPAGAEAVLRDVLPRGEARVARALGMVALRSTVSSPLRCWDADQVCAVR
jgi:hypothetical protein